ncbi:MAG: response regulator [Clostridia bacterium]|jgi:DNA-binding NarL/FixJ family response regulator|nr:response regulator transcription factor [Spirochaetia bacterium]
MAGTLIVDDHPLFREGLRAALDVQDESTVAGGFAPFMEADSVAKAVEILGSAGAKELSLVILDIGLPDGSGFDILERFAGRSGSPHFMMLSMYSERSLATRAIRASADGYASKQIPLEALKFGLKLVMLGQLFIEGEILRDVLMIKPVKESEANKAKACVQTLTSREREAFMILAEGGTTKDVAGRLGISQRSAENYQSAIYGKLEAVSPTMLVLTAIRAGMVEP